MPQFNSADYQIDSNATTPILARAIDLLADAFGWWLNGNLDDDNIAAGALSLDRVEGSAVSSADITTSGEANKIPKLDSSGNLNVQDGFSIKVMLQ